MPATAGRVRMPANNRMQTSASLNTHGIWQNAIGYDLMLFSLCAVPSRYLQTSVCFQKKDVVLFMGHKFVAKPSTHEPRVRARDVSGTIHMRARKTPRRQPPAHRARPLPMART
eukprot:6181234-Pleurochrysis_carterae.AAC.5